MAVALILASAFLHAFWNARLKRMADTDVAGAVIFLVTGLTAILAALLNTAWTGRLPFPGWQSAIWTLAAGVCEAGYFSLLVLAFRLAPLGTVYAVSRGFAILAAWPVSMLWLGEPVSALTVAGTLVLLTGLLASTVKIAVSGHGILLALGAGVFIAGYHLFYKAAIAAGGAPSGVFALSLAVAVPVNIALLPRERRALLLPRWRAGLVGLTALGVVCAGSFLLILLAFEFAGAGYVLTLRNSSIFFAFLLAWQMGETLTARQWAGAVLIAIGAVLLGLAT